MEDEIDVENFIFEVRNYPVLWDLGHSDYKDRVKKRAAWLQICANIFDNFQMKTEKEKSELGSKVMMKWKNLKDNYLRNLKKKPKSGQAAGGYRPYIYGNQMCFLLQVAQSQTTQSSLPATERKITADTTAEKRRNGDTEPPEEKNIGYPKKKKTLENCLIDYINTPIQNYLPVKSDNAESSDDLHFFKSLLPTLKTFSVDQKLEFRSEVLNSMKSIRNKITSNSTSISEQPIYSWSPNVEFPIRKEYIVHYPQSAPSTSTQLFTPPQMHVQPINNPVLNLTNLNPNGAPAREVIIKKSSTQRQDFAPSPGTSAVLSPQTADTLAIPETYMAADTYVADDTSNSLSNQQNVITSMDSSNDDLFTQYVD